MTATTISFAHVNDAEALLNFTADTVDFSLSGDNVLVSGIVGKRIYLYRIAFVVAGATNVRFKDGVSTNLSGLYTLNAGGSVVLDISNVPWYQTSTGKDLILNSSNAVQVGGTIYYQQK